MASPIDWQGLLKWSLKFQDSSKPSDRKPMSQEDKEFMEKAIKEYLNNHEDHFSVVETASKEITKNLESFRKEHQNHIDFFHHIDTYLITQVTVIQRCLDENPEVSRSLQRLNATVPLLDIALECARHQTSLVVVTLEVLSFALQNNPGLQAHVTELGGLSILKGVIMDLTHGPITEKHEKSSLHIKALTALGSLVRQHRAAEEDFVKHDGATLLINGMLSYDYRLQLKAAMFTKHLLMVELFPVRSTDGLATALVHLLKNRDVPEIGIAFGETSAELLQSSLTNFRLHFDRSHKLALIAKGVGDRLAYLDHLKLTHHEDDCSEEIKILEECKKMCRVQKR